MKSWRGDSPIARRGGATVRGKYHAYRNALRSALSRHPRCWSQRVPIPGTSPVTRKQRASAGITVSHLERPSGRPYSGHRQLRRSLPPQELAFNGVLMRAGESPRRVSSTCAFRGERRAGPVTVLIPGGSITGAVFAVITPCADSMCLVPFSGKPVTRSSSLHYDPMYPHADSIPWTAKFSADTLILTQEYTVGDDSRWIMSIRFRFASILTYPLSAEGVLVRREIDGVFTEVTERTGGCPGLEQRWGDQRADVLCAPTAGRGGTTGTSGLDCRHNDALPSSIV